MASSGSGVVRWNVNKMPAKNKLEESYSIAKEISNLHQDWEADAGHDPAFFYVRWFETSWALIREGKTRGQETS